MNTYMNDDSLGSPADIRAFLDGTSKVDLQVSAEQRHAWLAKTLKQMDRQKISAAQQI